MAIVQRVYRKWIWMHLNVTVIFYAYVIVFMFYRLYWSEPQEPQELVFVGLSVDTFPDWHLQLGISKVGVLLMSVFSCAWDSQ